MLGQAAVASILLAAALERAPAAVLLSAPKPSSSKKQDH